MTLVRPTTAALSPHVGTVRSCRPIPLGRLRPMFKRNRNRKTDPKFTGASRRTGSASSVADVRALLDNLNDTTTVASGDRVLVSPGQILENIRTQMERIDLDPTVQWSPEEAMSADEAELMFGSLSMGPMVIATTAWYARQILSARWPLPLVEGRIAPEARIEMFADGVTVSEQGQLVAKEVLCRALASAAEVEEHPELESLPASELSEVWISLLFWFGIKSSALHQHAGEQR